MTKFLHLLLLLMERSMSFKLKNQEPSWKATERVSATGLACRSGELVIMAAGFLVASRLGSNTIPTSCFCLCPPAASSSCCFALSPLIPMSDQMELLATSSTSSIRMVLGAHTLAFLPSSPSSRSRGCLPSPSVWESAAPDDETEGALVVVVGDVDDERPAAGPYNYNDGGYYTGHGRPQAPGTMQPQ